MSDSPAPPNEPQPASSGVRLNKAIADSGYCARRKADALISAGQVQVNGQTVTELGTKVNPQTDVITIAGKLLPKTNFCYLAFHKPVGYVTTRAAQRSSAARAILQGTASRTKAQHAVKSRQKTIYELLSPDQQSVDPAGRLDQNSSGLLILSNDGDFLYQITHPKFHWPKVYEIELSRALFPVELERLQKGILLQPENKRAQMHDIEALPDNPAVYRVTLITGYNRQIRRSIDALGVKVRDLHRVAFGPVELGTLAAGEIRPLTAEEIQHLRLGTGAPDQRDDRPE